MESIQKKFSDLDKELYRRTDEILHYLWDPIGISDTPQARSEYYGYLPQVFMKLKKGVSQFDLANYLDKIQVENIGMPSDLNRNKQIAEVLLGWKEVIEEKYSA